MSTYTPLTADEKAARLDEAHTRLYGAVDALVQSDSWLSYLQSLAQFHSYSAQNVLLILQQRPDASVVAGYSTWRKMGRQVQKGAKSIKVLAPMVIKDPDDETEKRIIGFRLVSVFDVADTDGEPLAEIPRCALLRGAGPLGVQDALEDAIRARGYEVQYVEQLAGANGVTDMTTSIVSIATEGRETLAMIKTLAHELGHIALEHGPSQYINSRDLCEVEAESVAYLVCDAVGIASDDYSVGYIATWSHGDPELILATASKVQKCAKAIIDVLDTDPHSHT